MVDSTVSTPPTLNTSEAPDPPPANRRSWLSALRWLIAIAAIVALILVARQAGGVVTQFAQWVDGLGWIGPIVFILGYIVATVAFLPGSLLTLAGGAIFGLTQGTLYVFVGASLGATAAFLVARYGARRAIEQRVAGNERFVAIDRAIQKEGRKIVFLLRLTPALPFNLLNYALGLTRVRLVDYIVACFGMIPGTLLYVYYGKVVGDVASLAAGTRPDQDWRYYTFLGLGLVAAIGVTAVVTGIARRALREAAGDGVASD